MALLTQNDLQVLEHAGHFEEARSAALDALQSRDANERCAGAFFLIGNMKFAFFPQALATVKALKVELTNDFAACNMIAFASWVKDDVELCRWASHRCIALNPAAPNTYRILGMLELGKQRFLEAFFVISAGILNCPKELEGFQVWYKLAKALTQGITTVTFRYEGMDFTFRLSTFNGVAMETACSHILGRFSEQDELNYLRQFVGRCDSIVEVGAAVGNHTVFFANTLSPKTVDVFDAFGPAVEQIRDNVSLNCSKPGSAKVTVHHAAVGATMGQLNIFEHLVPVVRLDEVLKHHVDFIKIDVDGMEMEVLEGCRGLFVRDRPKMMIEVQTELKPRFRSFIGEYNYEIEHEVVRPVDTNFFIKPRAA